MRTLQEAKIIIELGLKKYLKKYPAMPPDELEEATTKIKRRINQELERFLDPETEGVAAHDCLLRIIHFPVHEEDAGSKTAKNIALTEAFSFAEQIGINTQKIPSFRALADIWNKTKRKRANIARKLISERLMREHGLDARCDPGLFLQIKEAIQSARRRTRAFVYIRSWELSDGTKWYKIGKTNNLRRREVEQNVLPVPARTLGHIEAACEEEALEIESAILSILDRSRIKGASNRELFHLEPSQLQSILAAMDRTFEARS